MGLLWWNTLSRNKIWYNLYSDIWTKLTLQAPDRTWDEDLLPFKKTSFSPLYVEYVDDIFNPHPHIPHMRIFRIRMANPSSQKGGGGRAIWEKFRYLLWLRPLAGIFAILSQNTLWCCKKLKCQKFGSDHFQQWKDFLRKSDSFKVLWQQLVSSHSGTNNLADCCSRFL